MSDVTQILNAIEQGDTRAADELLPLVYEELRILAAQKMAQEKPGQTLQATALVHEAYIRLVQAKDQSWKSRGHFFRAAAEAMRRILVEPSGDLRTWAVHEISDSSSFFWLFPIFCCPILPWFLHFKVEHYRWQKM